MSIPTDTIKSVLSRAMADFVFLIRALWASTGMMTQTIVRKRERVEKSVRERTEGTGGTRSSLRKAEKDPKKAMTLEKSGIKIATITQKRARPVRSMTIPNRFHFIPGGIMGVPSWRLVTLFRRTMGTSRPRMVSRVRLSCRRGRKRRDGIQRKMKERKGEKKGEAGKEEERDERVSCRERTS